MKRRIEDLLLGIGKRERGMMDGLMTYILSMSMSHAMKRKTTKKRKGAEHRQCFPRHPWRGVGCCMRFLLLLLAMSTFSMISRAAGRVRASSS